MTRTPTDTMYPARKKAIRWRLLLSLSLCLSACGAPSSSDSSPGIGVVPTATMEMREVDGVAGPPNTSPTPKINNADADNRGEAIIAGQLLAYQYHASLRLPGDQVAAIAKTHEARCVAAGPKTCQVISSSTTNNGPNHVYANLDIRAAKSWMTPFREGLAQEADAAKGNLAAMSATAEDLTRSITDTAARLEAQKTLRARLIKLLERDTDKIGDLLQIERELARVQGEIESAQSYLRALNARVAMDRMTLNYEAIPKAISTGTTSPLVDAFRDFLGVLSSSLAMVIIFIAGAVPWIVVGIPVLWGLFKLVTRWRHKR